MISADLHAFLDIHGIQLRRIFAGGITTEADFQSMYK